MLPTILPGRPSPRVCRFVTALSVAALAGNLYSQRAFAEQIGGCDSYAAPAGAGDGLSSDTPFKIADFWPLAAPGKTLCLLDGVYDDEQGMINPPAGISGLSSSPITIKALNDGGVLLNGGGKRLPVLLQGNDWIVVQGVNACCSSSSVVSLDRSNHDVVRRVAAWDAAEGNNFIFGVHFGDYNLLEDVAGWGIARKIFSSSQEGNFTTVRRAWGRWEGSHVVGPKMAYELAYNNHDMTIENAIGTWSGQRMKQTYVLLDYNGQPWSGADGGTYTNYSVNQPYGIFVIGVGESNVHAKLLGSIAYVTSSDRFQAGSAIFAENTNFGIVQDTVAHIEAGANVTKNTFGLYGLANGAPTGDSATNVTGFGGAGPVISPAWQVTNALHGSSPASTYDVGENVFNTKRGANICHQYRDGVLTSNPLWPWPMNQRIADALVQSGHGAIDVDGIIEEMFGKIPDDCMASKIYIPVAAHLTGVGNRVFITDLEIQNPGDQDVDATLIFTPAAGGGPYEVSLHFAPHQAMSFEDVIASVFGLSATFGNIRLEGSSRGANHLRMTSRIYAQTKNGTLGQTVPGTADPTRIPKESWFVSGLAITDQFRSNLGATNTTSSPELFKIVLWDTAGDVVYVTSAISLAPGAQMQWSAHDLFPRASGKGFLAEFRPQEETPAPVAYGTVTDNLSSDPTYYSAMRPAALLYLPLVSKIAGLGGTQFASDLSVTNTSESEVTVTVTFLEHDRDNTNASVTAFSLSPHETRQMNDALMILFNRTQTFGSLKLESQCACIVAAERIYTPSAKMAGTVGQQIDPVTPEGLFSKGSLLGVLQNAAFRTNVGLFNPGSSWAAVNLALLASNGEPLGTTSVLIPPLGYIQRSLPELFGAGPFPSDAPLTLSVDAGGVKIFASATGVDNTSSDLTFSPGLF